MGYANGIRLGHAGGHLRDPALELVERIWRQEPRWWEVDDGNGLPFASPAAAYRHLGRLWHCSDTVPSASRQMAQDFLDVTDLTPTVSLFDACARTWRPS